MRDQKKRQHPLMQEPLLHSQVNDFHCEDGKCNFTSLQNPLHVSPNHNQARVTCSRKNSQVNLAKKIESEREFTREIQLQVAVKSVKVTQLIY